MQCLYVAGTMTECLLRRGVRLWDVSAYARLKMQCLCVAGTMTDCLLRRGVRLWEVTNAGFVCGGDHD